MSKSNIEWTEHTWNPIVGCSIVSPGCTNCYAMKMAARIIAMAGRSKTGLQYDKTVKDVKGFPVWSGVVNLAPDHTLFAPLHRNKPTTYFVNSMGDLFHEACPDAWIDRVFAVMALCPQHTFQILTKRADRMLKYFVGAERYRDVHPMEDRVACIAAAGGQMMEEGDNTHDYLLNAEWPLPNVWLGVSAERQQEFDDRWQYLRDTPAAVTFVSMEPLLGPIFFRPAKPDWIIVGGESGSGARPMHPDWVRDIRSQCEASGVPFFFKQWGNWHPEIDCDKDDPDWRQPYPKYREPHFQILNLAGGRGFHGDRVYVMRNCSKKSAGRSLDGAEYNGMPSPQRSEVSGDR